MNEQGNQPMDEQGNQPMDEQGNQPMDEQGNQPLDEQGNQPMDEQRLGSTDWLHTYMVTVIREYTCIQYSVMYLITHIIDLDGSAREGADNLRLILPFPHPQTSLLARENKHTPETRHPRG